MSRNSSVQLPFLSFHYLKYDKSKNSAKYNKILMSRFWEIVLCVPLLFHGVCLIKNTCGHASYRWPPAKLCSATLSWCLVFLQVLTVASWYSGLSLRFHVAEYMQLVGGNWTARNSFGLVLLCFLLVWR